jgi:hypothetical protein
MGEVPSGPSAHGRRPGGRQFRYNRADFLEACRLLDKEIASLGTSDPGSPPSLRLAIDRVGEGQKFGGWLTAQFLRAAHQTAADAALAIYNAIAINLGAVKYLLEKVAENYLRAEKDSRERGPENYLRAEKAVISDRIGRTDTTKADLEIPAATSSPVQSPGGPKVGELLIVRYRADDHPFRYSSACIAAWLEELRISRASGAHHDMALEYRAAADRIDELGRQIRGPVLEGLDAAWWSDVKELARGKIIPIVDTTSTLSERVRAFSYIEDMTADALEEALSVSWQVTSKSMVTHITLQDILAQLNGRYHESIDRYPERLTFDLPFGGPLPTVAPPPPTPHHEVSPGLEGEQFTIENGMIGGPPHPGNVPGPHLHPPVPDDPAADWPPSREW